MATEESKKRIARDIELYKKGENDEELNRVGGNNSSANIQIGTKDLMNQIQAGIQQADIEDAETEDNE